MAGRRRIVDGVTIQTSSRAEINRTAGRIGMWADGFPTHSLFGESLSPKRIYDRDWQDKAIIAGDDEDTRPEARYGEYLQTTNIRRDKGR